ncbi:MAG: DUF2189 domain-containing protein [Rhodospirillales bacterium]
MQVEEHRHPPKPPQVAVATYSDVKEALRAGLRDIRMRPGLSLFFGLAYAVIGGVLISGLLVFDQIWVVISAGVGFPLVAPFLAAGLYEMSRRLKRGEPFTSSDIFLVIFNQRRREYGWMAFIVLFVFWMWAYQVRILFAIFLQNQPIRSIESLITALLTTGDGVGFLIVGTIVGAILATILFSLTVISMPLLLDRDIDFVTAMITSVKTVQKSPVVMLSWGVIVGASTLLAILPGLLGVIIVFPMLGHASWHLYEQLIATVEE